MNGMDQKAPSGLKKTEQNLKKALPAKCNQNESENIFLVP
jgi:hypothetical protein